jgi:GNAT superfamily N-acetyltransferase
VHGALYAAEYGWDETFEALVAEIAAAFLRSYNRDREVCLIAEVDGERAGSAFVVQESDTTAKLRLVIVDRAARGRGVGTLLVQGAMRFARERGYTRMVLWTNDVLQAARRIYEREGFRLVSEETHHSFGVDLVGQVFDVAL